MPLRYAELAPQAFPAGWTAIQPWGALEWHGPHLPLGLDGLVAEWFAERLAERTGAILLPTQWNPITTLPHGKSLQITTDTFRALVAETLDGLAKAGATKIALITGHYAQGHMAELYQLAREREHVLVGTPLEPLDEPDLLDHAGLIEAAQLLAIRADLVHPEAIDGPVETRNHAVLGQDPRPATAAQGKELLERGLQAWAAWLADPGDLRAHYDRAISQYDAYRARYFKTSWEQAIEDWWAERTK